MGKQTPKIFIESIYHYARGESVGRWIDIDGCDESGILDEIEEFRKSLNCPDAEEFAVHDYDNLPDFGEFPDFGEVAHCLELMETYGIEVVESAVNNEIPLAEIEDRFQGTFESPSHWAEEYWDSTGMLREIPSGLQNHIDFEGFARECSFEGTLFDQVGGSCFVWWTW